MTIDHSVKIIPFSTEYKEEIKTLNLEWIETYFRVESMDEKILSNPQGEIIDNGGMIFYAQYQGNIVGTVSLIKIDTKTFELGKIAVTGCAQGLGIGNKLIEYCIATAIENNMYKIILYSNRRLVTAIHLFKKYGFREVPFEGAVYERADIKMERMVQ